MIGQCDMLAALLSERRRGELPPDQARALEAHLAECTRCREQAQALESVLTAVELPPIAEAELEALRARRIGEGPRSLPSRRAWRVPAVLVAAAAAAVLTISVRPVRIASPGRSVVPAVQPIELTGELLPAAESQDLFPDLSSDTSDESTASAEDDALSLEGAGLFGDLDG
jgi:anti-sigma factor RsiW